MDQASFLLKRGQGVAHGYRLRSVSGARDWSEYQKSQFRRCHHFKDLVGTRETPGQNNAKSNEADQEPLDPRTARLRTEAILFLSKNALSPRKLAQLAHLADATQARTLVRQLNQIYDDHHRAMRIEHVAGGYRMFTHPSVAPWMTRLGHLPPSVRISTPMMETLSVVAYHQPVSRAKAEAVRGVGCGELLRQLMERDLVRIVGRSEELGRPYLYGTTKRFLQLFGLRSIDALPPIQLNTLEDDPIEDSTNDVLSPSNKELVVSSSVAPVLTDTNLAIADNDPSTHSMDDAELNGAPVSEIEDEENEYYNDDDDEDDEWPNNQDDDWDDGDLDDDESDEDSDEDLDDDLDDDWEEVDDSDDDEDWGDDDDDEWDEDSDDEDDDEDWD